MSDDRKMVQDIAQKDLVHGSIELLLAELEVKVRLEKLNQATSESIAAHQLALSENEEKLAKAQVRIQKTVQNLVSAIVHEVQTRVQRG